MSKKLEKSVSEKSEQETRSNPQLTVTTRWYAWSLTAIFAIAFCVRIALVIAFMGLSSPPDAEALPDQVDYELFAYRMSEGLGYTRGDGEPTACRMPGTSLTILPVYYVFGRNYAAARILFCLMSAVTCLAVAWVASLAFGRATGLLAALMLAVYPNHAYYALHFDSEVPFALFVVLAMGATIQATRRDASFWSSVVAGLFWGFSILVRPNLVLALPFLWLLAVCRKENRGIQLKRVFLISVITFVVLTPWVARNKLVMGKPMLSSVGAYTFWGAHNHKTLEQAPGEWIRTSDLVDDEHPLKGTEVERTSQAWNHSIEFLKNNVQSLPYLQMMKMYHFLSPFHKTPNRPVFWAFALAWTIALPLLMVGVIVALREKWWEGHLLLLPLWATLAITMIFYGSIRFRDSVAPVYLIFAAIGFIAISQKLIQARQKKETESSEPGEESNSQN